MTFVVVVVVFLFVVVVVVVKGDRLGDGIAKAQAVINAECEAVKAMKSSSARECLDSMYYRF